jgi:type VI secretion system secreted protein VgrG
MFLYKKKTICFYIFLLQKDFKQALSAGGSFVRINASGVTIQGPMIKINSGGSAGKIKQAKPKTPKQPQEADNAKPGKQFKVPPVEKVWQAIALDFPTLTAQKLTLLEAAKSGTPFCNCKNL